MTSTPLRAPGSRPVLCYHVNFGCYGHWLPNDPRGSSSQSVRATNLRPFGPATHTSSLRSVAAQPHNRAARFAAKRALVRPPVRLTGLQARAVGRGFARIAEIAGFRVFACAVLPTHTHLVVARHHHPVEETIRRLKQAATQELLSENRHPFADQRLPSGHLPSVWAHSFRCRFLFSADEIRETIEYVENNPIKDGLPRQGWNFVVPFDGEA